MGERWPRGLHLSSAKTPREGGGRWPRVAREKKERRPERDTQRERGEQKISLRTQKHQKLYLPSSPSSPSLQHLSLSLSEAMLEESVASAPSIWTTMNSWFTPSVFFVLLNLMIGTIFITSSLSTHKPKEEEQEPHQQQHEQQQHHEESPKPQQLTRSPSMLKRLKSINFYSNRSQEPNAHFGKAPEMEPHYGFLQQSPEVGQEQEGESEKETPFLTGSPLILDRLKSFNLYKYVSQEASFSPTHHGSEHPHEPEQHRAQAEEEEQVDPAGDKETGGVLWAPTSPENPLSF